MDRSSRQQDLAPAEAWKSARADLECRLPCTGEDVQNSNRLSRNQWHDHLTNSSRFRTLQEVQNEVNGDHSAVSQHLRKAVLAANYQSLSLSLPNKQLETLAQRAEALLVARL